MGKYQQLFRPSLDLSSLLYENPLAQKINPLNSCLGFKFIVDSSYLDINDQLQHLLNTGNWNELNNLLSTAAPEDWSSDCYYYASVSLAYGLKPRKIPEAIKLLHKSLELDSTNEKSQSVLCEIYMANGHPEKARDHAAQLLQLAPKKPLSHLLMGKALATQQKYQEAADYFSNSIHLASKQDGKLIQTAQALIKKYDPAWWAPLSSKNIQLHRLTSKYRDYYESCFRNSKLHSQLNAFKKIDSKAFDIDIEKNKKSPFDSKKIDWIVVANHENIGLVSLVDINFNNRRAEFIIGFPSNTRSPMKVVEATYLAIHFAFKKLDINRVYCYIYSNNPTAQTNALKVGFQQEGNFREHVINPTSGEILDLHLNGLLRHEFYQNDKIIKLLKRWHI